MRRRHSTSNYSVPREPMPQKPQDSQLAPDPGATLGDESRCRLQATEVLDGVRSSFDDWAALERRLEIRVEECVARHVEAYLRSRLKGDDGQNLFVSIAPDERAPFPDEGPSTSNPKSQSHDGHGLSNINFATANFLEPEVQVLGVRTSGGGGGGGPTASATATPSATARRTRTSRGKQSAMASSKSGLPVEAHVEVEIRYDFVDSIWDASFLAFHPCLGLGGSLQVILLLAFNIAVQVIFTAMSWSVLAERNFGDDVQKELSTWRTNIGQNVKYYDELTLSSLSERLCLQDPKLPVEMSSRMSSILQSLITYWPAVENSYESQTIWEILVSGPTLTLLALMVWCLTTIHEVFECWNCLVGVWWITLDRKTHLFYTDEGGFQLAAVSWSRKAFAIGVLLVRMAIVLCLWYAGCGFLVNYSIDAGDLILNAVALEVVLAVDQAFFALAPCNAKNLIHALEPLPAAQHEIQYKGLDLRTCFFTLCFLGALAFMGLHEILPMVGRIEDAYEILCGGNANFTYGVDAMYLVWISDSNPFGITLEEIGAFPLTQAIEEAIYPERIPTWETSLSTVSAEMSLRPSAIGVAAVAEADSFSVQESAVTLQSLAGTTCGDTFPVLYGVKRFVMEATKSSFSPLLGRAAESCSELSPVCSDPDLPLIRAACSKTCGCEDPAGPLMIVGPDDGCPQACNKTDIYQEQVKSLPCEERTPEEMRQNANWTAWSFQLGVKVVDLLERFRVSHWISLLCAGGNGNCSEMLINLGCGVKDEWEPAASQALNKEVNVCSGDWAGDYLFMKPLSLMCPETCGCSGTNLTEDELVARNCPGKCAAT